MAIGRLRNGEQVKRGRRPARAAGKADRVAAAEDGSELKKEYPSPERALEHTMSRALRLLAGRSRTEAELRKKLSDSSITRPETIELCIARLKELALIDDRRFAEHYARSRMSAKPIGRQRLARQLAAKSIDRKTTDEVLNELFDNDGEEPLLAMAIEKHVRLHGPPKDRAAMKKLFDHLVRRGFEYERIRKELRAIALGFETNDG